MPYFLNKPLKIFCVYVKNTPKLLAENAVGKKLCKNVSFW